MLSGWKVLSFHEFGAKIFMIRDVARKSSSVCIDRDVSYFHVAIYVD